MNHLEPHEPTMNHIENPMTNMKHHEPLMTPPRNSLNQKDPLSFSNRPAHADPRDLHRPQFAAVRQVAISTPVLRDHLKGNPAYRKSRREQDQKRREGRRKGVHVTTSYRKEKRNIPRMEEGKEQREGDFHLSSTRLTVCRCLHRVSG